MFYRYVGSHDLLKLLQNPAQHFNIQNPGDVLRWITETKQPLNKAGIVTATFIIDTSGQLWISDQRSEHVVCARGQDVLSAGEMTFQLQPISVVAVTNQSTGYCPQPESWSVVAYALTPLGIPYPDQFTSSYLFRWCTECQTTNIIKDEWFECAVCQSPLPELWNYAQHPAYAVK